MTVKLGDFHEKPHFTVETFKFWEAGVGIENLWTTVPNVTPFLQIWSNKSFGYVAVAVFNR